MESRGGWDYDTWIYGEGDKFDGMVDVQCVITQAGGMRNCGSFRNDQRRACCVWT